MKNFHHLALYQLVLVISLFYNSVLVAQCPTECVSSNTFVGTNAGAANDNTVGVGNTFIGQSAGPSNTEGERNTFVGQNAGAFNTIGDYNSFFGEDAGYSNTVASRHSFFGRRAGFSNTIGEDNSFFGALSGDQNVSGGSNSFFGVTSGYSNIAGDFNSFFGKDSGYSNTGGNSNAFFGYCSGAFNNEGWNNSFFGTNSGYGNTTGHFNSFFGVNSGADNVTGRDNSFFGGNSARNLEHGSENSFFGRSAGVFLVTGDQNCFFGTRAASEGFKGNGNSFFGYGSGLVNEGSYNVGLGYLAGDGLSSADSTICIGAGAGPNNPVSNRLYINIGRDDDPLIYGEFDNDLVRINGSFEVTAGLTNPSSRSLKDDFTYVNAHSVLDKIDMLHIEEWSYKEHPEVRHVGAVAEEFYDAFGLGSGPKNISTIDADGIALLAIQALSDKVGNLEEENAQLIKLIHIMKEDIALLKTEANK